MAYFPIWHAGYVWDDDHYVTANPLLHSLDGLRQIWFLPGATSQYYPLTYSVFWLEYHLWGLNPTGYHLVNLLLHALNAVLFWLFLRKLKVPGAWLAGAFFAIHPVTVMSVAWITELKNTLSTSLGLMAALSYLNFAALDRFEPEGAAIKEPKVEDHRWRFYLLSLAFFQLALFAKTAVSFIPVSLLLIVWWKRKRMSWNDVWPLIPLFLLGVLMGGLTIYMEQHFAGASGTDFHFNFLQRLLVSGRSFWFYLGKIIWPVHLAFFYGRWQIDTANWHWYAYLLATLALLSGLWAARRYIGKGPWVAAMHFYICTSLLILVVTLYMMRYSFVSDHWQYFGCMGVFAVAAAGIARLWEISKGWIKVVNAILVVCLLSGLGVLTWHQCRMYSDLETLWRSTIAIEPDAGIAHENLGVMLVDQKKYDEAIFQLESAIKLQPDFAEAYYNLGNAYIKVKELKKAIRCFEQAISRQPNYMQAYYDMGNAFLHANQLDEAISQWQEALRKDPEFAPAHNNLGNAFIHENRLREAEGHFKMAIEFQPDFVDAYNNLGDVLIREHRTQEAVQRWQQALAYDSNCIPSLNNLAWAIATAPESATFSITNGLPFAIKANQLSANQEPIILRTLAAAYARQGEFTNAVQVAQRAIYLAQAKKEFSLAQNIQQQLELYQKNRPLLMTNRQ